MRETYEISDRFIGAGDANHLLYEPLSSGLTFRRTRRYELEFEGERTAMDAFVRKTLFDEISHDLHEGEEPGLSGFTFFLDYGMKPGALDLEKEAILRYYAGITEPGFTLKNLKIRQRIYLFGGKVDESDRFVRDICNAAIHQWNVTQANV
ncbi:MAG: hypothetical protein NWR21_13200 [Verrucomicrobiales bacterium]|jgi:hypothetical protein|nr:hypothetical protein [Verrucomicrobiales bacterium]MDP4638827.1 hypothetical protein [Verrucomicrobiales bacterium]MDP4792351.1 hypothetical protein [Verrucomicrobiales bacterium]MDP4940262.1 hypothetical protein [Verrucomicrobiales bacterium]MDP5004855.1 hypothetical protein [Verrucomicrobiales bacterium]